MFLNYLENKQHLKMTEETRKNVMNYSYQNLCRDLTTYGAGNPLVVIQTASNSNLCTLCRGNDRHRTIIDHELSAVQVVSHIQEVSSYCRICDCQMFLILKTGQNFKYFIC